MDPTQFPVADQPIASSDIESSPTSADLIEVYDATNQNERKAISLGDLLKGLLPIITASLKLSPTEYIASGAIDVTTPVSYVELNKSDGALAMTIAAPVKGQLLVITQTDSGTQGHTVTLSAGDFDGTNEIATFDAQEETLVLFGLSATRYAVLANIGSVALSTAG